jgi:hypothetical protein
MTFLPDVKPEKFYATKTIFHSLGRTLIPIKIEQFGTQTGLIFINLHDDEMTAVDAARKLLEKEGGLLIKIENRKKREIRFYVGNRPYRIDPNRIFSREGIEVFLQQTGRYSPQAVKEVEKFGQKILQLIPATTTCVIALHNNTNGFFSVKDYLPGSNRAVDAAEVHFNADEDPDDLFITTDKILFHYLSLKNYNTVLQDNDHCRQDGSLSVYCGKNNIRYVNLETEHGKFHQYIEMLNYLHEVLTTKNLTSLEYFFSGVPDSQTALPEKNAAIYFGARRVGKIQSVWLNEQTNKVNGIIEVNPDFPLYSNMNIYPVADSAGVYRFEIRIDPTIERTKLNPSKDVVELVIKVQSEQLND